MALLMGQLFEVRHARLARLTVAAAGVTVAQWWTLIVLVIAAMSAVSVVHNHHFGIQVLAVSIYAFATAASFFVILAHDRPFLGILSVSPGPLQQLAGRSLSALAPWLYGA